MGLIKSIKTLFSKKTNDDQDNPNVPNNDVQEKSTKKNSRRNNKKQRERKTELSSFSK